MFQTSAIKYVFSFTPNQSNSEVGNMTSKSDVVYNTLLVFLLLINGKSVACLFQTIIRIGNPVNHLSELLHCSPSHMIGQQRQGNNHVSRGSKRACCDR